MNNVIMIFFILLIVTTQISCSEKKNDTPASVKNDTTTATATKESSEKNTEKKITFVELGSVKCVPCKMMEPIMEDIKKEFAGKVDVVFYDVWTEAGRPYGEKFKIRAIPTQVFLDKDGKEYFRHEGFFPKEELVKILEQGLK